MASLQIQRSVAEDLAVIRASSVVSAHKAAMKIAALLREAGKDPDLADRLITPGEQKAADADIDFNVAQVSSLRRAGFDVTRIKVLDLERVGLRYRVLCAYFPVSHCVVVMAAVDRDAYNYEPEHPITIRVKSSYQQLVDDGWT